ncbi:HAD-IC family P-type ATPase [Streptomyces rubiginosohelvolus]|uniref:HAD-IC family P-type ATPase n=1 Tax=Streptomyces rubiginosohelvolus TaxID=67362 RepID=UPI00380D955A
MSSVLDQRPVPAAAGPRPAAMRRRPRVLALPEARWALVSLALFLLALPVYLAGGPSWLWGVLFAATYITGGWESGWEVLKALKAKTLDVDLLMVVASLGAAAIGQVLDGALLIVIFATSGALEAVATARTADSVRGLLDLAPTTAARLLTDGGEETIPAEELKVGDTVLVRPGERVGADGQVVEGASDVGQATITGEPLPVAKQAGDEVFAGTVNGTGALRVRVERDPADSVIARIVKMVEEASETKAPTQLFIEKIEQRYSIGMVLGTLAVFAIPLAFGDELSSALLRAMTFMIVASPCAVVLSTMPPLLSAIANAGRHGVLAKSAVVMERLGQVDMSARKHVMHVLADSKSEKMRERALRFVRSMPCPECHGSGLRPEALAVTFAGRSIAEVNVMPLTEVAALLRPVAERSEADATTSTARSGETTEVAVRICADLVARVAVLLDLGLGYLSLGRRSTTLSPGEAQRLRIATQLRSGLFGVVYVLDEPSAGLHPADAEPLLEVLERLKKAGNSLFVVEHDMDVVRRADWVVDIGPGAGEGGGRVL